MSDFALLCRTVLRLRPGQLAHRTRLRSQQAALRRWPAAGRQLLAGPAPDSTRWPAKFEPMDAKLTGHWPGLRELQAGKIRLLGAIRDLGDPPDWQQLDAPRLWRFHLHYWDWSWGLATAPDRLAARAVFARLWRSWQAQAGFRHPDAWHPYPAALRAWSWCGVYGALVTGSDIEREFLAALAAHTRFLHHHLEYDVCGNHLIKDLKALAGLSVFLGDERLLRTALVRLERQLAVQILPDGGHYERAPAYHCQVLADLLDVAGLLSAAGRAPSANLTGAIGRMRDWLGAVLLPSGQVPLLNDGFPVPPALPGLLRPAPAPQSPLVVLRDTGLVRAVTGDWHLLADVGPPCPPGLPAHAHADTLGCVLHVAGEPLLTDTGTSSYEPGPARRYERSTAAHSTVELDGADSTEVWAAFRAARLARVSRLAAQTSAAGVTFSAAHDGYRRLPGRPRHTRRWSLTSTGLQVDDLVTGRGRHQAAARWQLPPGSQVQIAGSSAHVRAPAGRFTVRVRGTVPVTLTAETRPVATGFDATADAPALTCRFGADLPVRVTTALSQEPDGTGTERPG